MLLGKNLLNIGLIGADEEKYVGARTATFCPHHVSHHLGMDVHDTPSVSKTSPLLPGMVITLEPGCYVPASMEKVGNSNAVVAGCSSLFLMQLPLQKKDTGSADTKTSPVTNVPHM